MKKTHLFGTMMACTLAAAVSVGAQDSPTTSQSERDSKTVVVTGCLKSDSSATGTAGTAGTTGTAGSTASASRNSFIITDAVVAGGGSTMTGATGATAPTGSTAGTAGTGSTAGTAGTTPSASTPGTAMGKTFAIVGGQQSELQRYVNSQVEIRGTLDPNAKASTAGAPTTGTPTTATPTTGTPTTATPTTATPTTGTGSTMAGMAHASDHQKLNVTSVRQIASSCQ